MSDLYDAFAGCTIQIYRLNRAGNLLLQESIYSAVFSTEYDLYHRTMILMSYFKIASYKIRYIKFRNGAAHEIQNILLRM